MSLSPACSWDRNADRRRRARKLGVLELEPVENSVAKLEPQKSAPCRADQGRERESDDGPARSTSGSGRRWTKSKSKTEIDAMPRVTQFTHAARNRIQNPPREQNEQRAVEKNRACGGTQMQKSIFYCNWNKRSSSFLPNLIIENKNKIFNILIVI
jgi:hypothetical protein